VGKKWCSIARYKFQGTFALLGLFLSATRKARLYLGYGVRLRLTHTRYFCPLFGVVLFFCESPRSLQSCVGFNLAKFLKTTTHLTVICIYDMSQKRDSNFGSSSILKTAYIIPSLNVLQFLCSANVRSRA
jgi:hypothetical protein